MARESAGAVFEGRVTEVTALGTGVEGAGRDLVIALSVTRTWKNATSEQILVRTRAEGPACGFTFERDQTYLVYAQAVEPEGALPGLSVSHCSRTRAMAEAGPDIAELGMGVVPVSPATKDAAASNAVEAQHERPAAGGCASCSLGQRALHTRETPRPLWIVALLGGGLAVLRRKANANANARTRVR